jgi:mono/diheme cytochrome c family protein
MPPIPLSQEETDALVLYLKSLRPGAPAPAIVLPSVRGSGTRATAAEGRELYRAARCMSCHPLAGHGVSVGPALDSFGKSGRGREWLLGRFRDPDALVPGTPMPAVRGPVRQLESLTLYLLSQRNEQTPTPAWGQRIYTLRNCGYCHGPGGRGGSGPRLAGARKPGRTDAWLLEHIRDPAAVRPGSRMPRVWASDGEQQALLEYLKTLWLQDVPASGAPGSG